MENRGQLEDFDPSETDGFQKNLSKAFETDHIGTEPIDIVTDESPSILTITEEGEGGQEGTPEDKRPMAGETAAAKEASMDPAEELPIIDTSFAFEDEVPQEEEVDDKVLENISSQLASQVNLECTAEENTQKKKRPGWLVPVLASIATFLFVVFFFFFTAPGRRLFLHTSFGKYLVAHIGGMLFEEGTAYKPGVKLPDPFLAEAIPVTSPEPDAMPVTTAGPTPTPSPEPDPDGEIGDVQEIYHILLLGMDENEDGAPQADLVVLATLDTGRNEVKLTTVLRNLLVQVPGHMDDRIGAVYSAGGISLVYDVFENAFGVRPDGYILFTYGGFEQVIDALGGVSMAITAKEADYLNRTNYITLPENRGLGEGINHLNGDQALGYCRIRHVGTAQNEYNDIGRAARCRRLITAVFEQGKSKGALELYQAAKLCFSYLVTDITGEECTKYLELLMGMDGIRISDYRIPSEGTYQTSIIRGSSALVADMGQNRALWQAFLYPAPDGGKAGDGPEE